MLSRLFNWIKFKTLPPSVNFKNRLFIERDNKQKRVFNGLGLTYRNSKWSDYRRSNVNLNTLLNFKIALTLLLILSLSLIFMTGYGKYFLGGNLTSRVGTILWFIHDTSSYTLFITFPLFLFSIRMWITSQLNTWIFNLDTSNIMTKRVLTPNNFSKKHYSTSSNKDLLYKYLIGNNPTTSSLLRGMVTSNYFGDYSNSFFTQCFRLLNILHTNHLHPLASLSHYNRTSNMTILLNKYSNLKSTAPTSTSNSLWVLKNSTIWTLQAVQLELFTNIDINSHRGLFTTNFKHFSQVNKIFNESQYLSTPYPAINKQVDWVRISRWLYRYNLLHRRTITGSHKTTLTKRLINSGFYDSELNSHNIQVSSLKTLNPDFENVITLLSQAAYGNFFNISAGSFENKTSTLRNFNSTSSKLISFSEESFFWFTKRFYLLNSLPTLSRSINFINHSTGSSAALTNPSTFDLDNLLISQNNLHYLTNKDLKTSNMTTNFEVNEISSENQFLLHVTNYDLFSYDFTDLAIQILRKPTSTNTTYPYYSFTSYSNVSQNVLSTWTFHKLK
jgi:hypothetical protein